MINLLRKNYGRTLWLTRLALGLAVILGQFFSIESNFAFFASVAGIQMPRTWYVYLIYAVFAVVIIELLTRLFTKLLLFNVMKVYVIPFNEFVVLFLAATAGINIVAGLIKLVYLITPAAFVFGEVLINFVVSAAVYFCLFLFIKKFYLNDKNSPYIFKWSVWIFLALSVINAFVF